jgi:hypothetical protein
MAYTVLEPSTLTAGFLQPAASALMRRMPSPYRTAEALSNVRVSAVTIE